LQTAAVETLAAFTILGRTHPACSTGAVQPAARVKVIAAMLSVKPRTPILLKALEDGQVEIARSTSLRVRGCWNRETAPGAAAESGRRSGQVVTPIGTSSRLNGNAQRANAVDETAPSAYAPQAERTRRAGPFRN